MVLRSHLKRMRLSSCSCVTESYTCMYQAVISAMAAAMPWVFLAVLGYSTNTVLSGVLRGAGRQALGLIVNLVTLWLVRYLVSHRN